MVSLGGCNGLVQVTPWFSRALKPFPGPVIRRDVWLGNSTVSTGTPWGWEFAAWPLEIPLPPVLNFKAGYKVTLGFLPQYYSLFIWD